MKIIKTLLSFIMVLILASCENDKSLQKYYVENQEDSDFLALDVPTSMFTNNEALDEDQRTTLESVQKINLLALKAQDDPAKFEDEKAKLDKIFTDEKYQLLMKYGGGGRKAALYFTGKEDAIDELIVYGFDNEKGLGVARVLGENMNPAKIMELMKSIKKDKIHISGLEGLGEILGSHHDKKDSLHVDVEINTDSISKGKDSITK